MGNPRDYIFELPANGRPERIKLPEEIVADIDWFNANRSVKRRYDPVLGIKGVVIHATAGSTTGGALQHWRTASPASAHWIIPGESEKAHGKSILAVVYEARAANHTKDGVSHPQINGGAALVDHWTLGVEIVNTQDIHNYTDPYSGWQVDMAALIVRYCWAKYPNLKWIFSHAAVDPATRNDPGPQFPWDAFKAKVLQPSAALKTIKIAAPLPEAGEMADETRKPCCAAASA